MSTITNFRVRKKYNETDVFFFLIFLIWEHIFSLGSSYNELAVLFSVFFSAHLDLQTHLGPIQTTKRCEGAATSLPMGHDLATGARVQTHKRQRSPEMIKFFGWITSK